MDHIHQKQSSFQVFWTGRWSLRHRLVYSMRIMRCYIVSTHIGDTVSLLGYQTPISRIQRFASPQSHAASMSFDADLISMIASFRRDLRCRFQPVWVKGHQDNLQSYEHLPISARLNVDADYLATRYRQRERLQSSAKITMKRPSNVPSQ
jgi:hypothetical protein